MEKWMIRNPKNDFKSMSKLTGISELLCRILVNRQISDIESIKSYIEADYSFLHNPSLMKDLKKGAEIIRKKICEGKKIRIVGDFDVDGIISTFLLFKALSKCGAKVDYDIPHRVLEGYGINNNIVEKAGRDLIDTIITCDNGISAIEQVELAKSLGMTVIITDHHEVPFEQDDEGNRYYKLPNADAIVDIKQEDCNYPFKALCGAGVVFKFIQVLYNEMGIHEEEAFTLMEYVAIATVCDVVDLVGENRVFVKKGLEMINNTKNIGLKALMRQIGIEGKEINVYYLGFIIGPCFNASGRLDCAKKGIRLLITENEVEAGIIAADLNELNTERKDMTIKGVEEIANIIENSSIKHDRIFLVYKPDIHESIAGIIAGKIKEKYNVPTIILTDSEHGVKGSGRSIEEYNMFEELLKCKDLLTKFGGHPMAAGLTLISENIDTLRERLNKLSTLTDEDLNKKVFIDAQIPLENVTLMLAEELTVLEPYGKGNSKPLFAQKNVSISKAAVLGNKKNVLKLRVNTVTAKYLDCIYFGDIKAFDENISLNFGQHELDKIYKGQTNNVKIDIIFNIEINEYNGNRSVQLVMQYYR